MKAVIAAVLLLSVVVSSGCVQQDTTGSGAPVVTGGGEDVPPTVTYTLAEVAAHATADDCWLAIHGEVYDVTAFISNHPGGAAILQGCGKDATDLFETRPMGSGTPHSEKARGRMQDYYIGSVEDA